MENRITPVTQTGRAFKYQFDLEIQRVFLEIPFPCVVEVSWRRGNKSIQTKNKIDLQGQEKHFDVGEKMSMISTCYLDDNTHRFSEKNSMLNIIIFINSVPKSGGCCPLDLSQVLNPFNHKECMPRSLQLPLVKCPIKNSKICLILSGVYLQEMVQDDRSIGSGISSALNYSDSNFSMSFNRRTFEPPSKDTASAHQQDGAPRFNSVSRRSDENGLSIKESISKKKAETVGQISFGAPLVSITENIGYESEKSISITQKVEECYQLQVTREKGFSINSVVPTSTSPPRNSINPCSNSNKVLKEQKLKQEKFKLQTENTQLKMFVQEQSKRLNEYLNDCSNLKQQLRTKEINLERQAQHLSAVTKQLKALQDELDRQRQTISGEQSRSSAKVVELQKQISIQMKEVETKIAEREQLNQQYGLLQNQYANLRNAYERLKNEFEKEKQNGILLRGETETVKISFDQMKRQTDEQISILNSKVTQRQAHIEHLRREILSIKQARQLDQSNVNTMNEKANILDNKCKQLQRALVNNGQRLKLKEKQTQQKDVNLSMLHQRFQEQKRSKQQILKKFEQAKARAEQARLKMQQAQRKAQEMNIQLQWRDTQLRNIEHVHDQLQAQMNQQSYEASKSFDESQKRITELLLQVGSLERELHTQRNGKSQKESIATAKIMELEQRIAYICEQSDKKVWSLNKEFQVIERNLKNTCEQLKKQIVQSQEQFQGRLFQTSQSTQEMNKRLSLKDTEITSLQKINNDLKNQISQLSADLANSKLQFTRLLDINRKNSSALRDFQLTRSDLQRANLEVSRLNEILGVQNQELIRREKQAQQAKAKGRVLCEQVQQLIIQNEQQTKKIKQLEQQQLPNQYNTIGRLRFQMNRMQQQLQQQKAVEACQQQSNSSQMTNLMKQNIQLQISLKVREEEARKCQQYAQELATLKNKLEFQIANNKELQQQMTVMEKELKEKTRASIIESEKARMLFDERDSFVVMLNEKSTALEIEKDKTEVLDRNLRELQHRYDAAVTRIRELETTLRTISSDMSRKNDRSDQIRTYQRRLKELQTRDVEKIHTIEQLTRNLYKSNDTIKDLHRNLEQRTKDLSSKEKIILQLEQKLSNLDQTKKRSSEVVLATNQRRNLERKNELLLSELCILRQRIDEQARVPCDIELTQKIAGLENQLLRRDEKLKRLEKENSKLEQENIQLNIRIMKELTEIQKKQEGIKSEYSKSLNKVLSDSHA